MNYKVLLLKRALAAFGSLPKADYEQISQTLQQLSREAHSLGGLSIADQPGRHLRSGDYRIIYEVDDEGRTVTVFYIGRRRNSGL
jgi:mRNA-degrading endonuclease RelE of RelBE toxin-antitoxin system